MAEQTQSAEDFGAADVAGLANVAVERLPEQDALRALGSGPAGLSSQAAEAALQRHGPNRLPELHRPSPLWQFVAQFGDFFAILLEVAGTITLATYLVHGGSNNLKVALAIFAVVLLNAIIGFTQEYRAERTAEALKRLLPARARVLRDGAAVDVAAEALVPGDVVLLAEGDAISADCRLINVADLATNDAALTGESVETLGSTTIICTDKTGTLTAGEMTASAIWCAGRSLAATGIGYTPEGRLETAEGPVAAAAMPDALRLLLRAGVHCNDARLVHDGDTGWGILGDPTEGALLVLAAKAGYDIEALTRQTPRLREVPFARHQDRLAGTVVGRDDPRPPPASGDRYRDRVRQRRGRPDPGGGAGASRGPHDPGRDIPGDIAVAVIERNGRAILPTLGVRFEHGDVARFMVAREAYGRFESFLGMGG